MATSQSKLDQLYRVMGASRAAGQHRRVGRSMRNMATAARAARGGILGLSSVLSGNMLAVAAVGMAVRRTVSEYARYTIAVSRVNTTLAAQVSNHREVTRSVGSLAEHVGRDLAYSLTESNEAMQVMLQTGIGTHESMRVFRTSMQLARVADMDTARATQFLTDTMNMFEQEQAATGETTQQFSRRMSSQLIVAANSASTSVEQLQQAFRYAGGELSSLGYSSQDVILSLIHI